MKKVSVFKMAQLAREYANLFISVNIFVLQSSCFKVLVVIIELKELFISKWIGQIHEWLDQILP